MKKVLFTLVICPALVACSTTAGEPEVPERGATPGYACVVENLRSFVGQSANEEIGANALKQSGAKNLRWIAPRSAITMDFRQDRLNIEYDDAMTITRVYCG